MFAPANVPADRLALLEKQTLAAIQNPDAAKRITDSGAIPNAMKGKDFGAFIAKEVSRMGEVVRSAGIEAS